jgi:hypothetical protein
MKTCSANAAQELAAWIVLATFGLVAPARERIKQEIEAHFADAVVAHTVEGLSQDAAEAKALDELGDIHSAAKAFQKKHLTEEEEKWLQDLQTEDHSRSHSRRNRYFLRLFLTIILTIWSLRWSTPQNFGLMCLSLAPLWCFTLVSAVYQLRCWYLMKRMLAGPKLWRKFLVRDMINDLFNAVFGLSLFLFQLMTHPGLAASWFLFFSSLFLLGFIFFDKRFRVWRKLGNGLVNPEMAVRA